MRSVTESRISGRSEVKQNGMEGNKLFGGINAGEYGRSGALQRSACSVQRTADCG